jgi:hypothetical protein
MQRRLTIDEESHLRAAWSVLQKITKPWEEISRLQRAIWEMVANSTTNGLPYVEPPLTDEDARARILVMCRDRETASWQGPHVFAAKGGHFFYAFISKGEVVRPWNHCRRATPAEIAAAGLEVTK